jgi:hypothetical protein
MGKLANTRDSSVGTTSGAAIAKGASWALPGATGWSMPTGITPLAIGLIAFMFLLVYWDRRVVLR